MMRHLFTVMFMLSMSICLTVSITLSSQAFALSADTTQITASEKKPFDNPRFEEIFKQVDDGDINDASFPILIEEMAQLIAEGDIERTYRLMPKQCMAYNFLAEQQNQNAQEFLSNIYNHYPDIPPAISIELKLCEATLLRYKGEITEANEMVKAALNNAQQIANERLIADAYSMLGQIASYTGDFAFALKNLLEAYERYQQLGLITLERLGLLDLAITYRRLGETDTALKYYAELEQAFSDSNQIALVMLVKNDMAYAYEDINEYQKAADYYLAIFKYYEEVHSDPTFTARVAVDMSSALIRLGQYQQALDYLDKFESVISPSVDTHYSFLHLYKAQAKHGLGLTEQAIPHLKKSTAGFNKNHNKRGHEMLLELKVEIYESLGLWQQAYEAQLKLYDIHLILDKALENQASTEMRVKFDSEKIEAENAELVAFHQLKDQQLSIKQDNERLQIITLALGFASILLLILFSLYFNKKSKQLKELALTDLLTQLPNRLSFYREAQDTFNRLSQHQQPFSIISIDIDHFKQVNDQHGHSIGDIVLKTIAQILRRKISQTSVMGRVGGEEFLVLLPNTRSQSAIKTAQTIIDEVNFVEFSNFSENLSVTVSAGVAAYKDEAKLTEIIKKADLALYQAKNQGRNQVVYFRDDA
ncbi:MULTISPECIES: tetratricopeptide repeat-containing diguanylate cyclase [Shewanella]|uniref:tetratricopeptide repeat-containing diguanylate cyclase n=1 Tax=Shewanella TaxID=22 RepID=UPI001BC671F3|nr:MULTISPECIES: tetratricopeptide repeat-containing diguanylate cyclase [Shewanella]GIU48354.1 GGDEF domain-containing protein [Shewanella sp. KT0246]